MSLSKKFTTLFVVILLLSIVYTLSGIETGNYYTKFQSDDANDLNFMLYWSQEYFIQGRYNYFVTWGSLGIMLLLQLFVEIAKTHDFTIIAFGIIMWFIIRDYFRMHVYELRRFHWILFILVLAGSLTYITIPGKGSLSFITFYLALKYLHKGNLIYLIGALVLAGLNRPVEILVIFACLIYIKQSLKKRVLWSAFILLSLIVAPLVGSLVADYLGLDIFDKSKMSNNFGSYSFLWNTNAVVNFLLAPLRLLAVSVSVVSSSIYSWGELLRIIDEPGYFYWRIFPIMLRLVSGLYLIYAVSLIILRLRYFLFSSKIPRTVVFAVMYFVIYGYMITINGVEEKSRYFLLFPIMLMPVMCYVRKRI